MCATIHMPYITFYQFNCHNHCFTVSVSYLCILSAGKTNILNSVVHPKKSRILYWIRLSVAPGDFQHYFDRPALTQLLIILITSNRSYFWGLRKCLYLLLHTVYFEILWSNWLLKQITGCWMFYDGVFSFLEHNFD